MHTSFKTELQRSEQVAMLDIRKNTPYCHQENSPSSKSHNIIFYILKKSFLLKFNMIKIRWIGFPNFYVLALLESYFELKSPARSEKVMAFKVWLLEFLAQSDILKSTNNLNYFIMTQHNCLVMNFFLNAYTLYLKIKI